MANPVSAHFFAALAIVSCTGLAWPSELDSPATVRTMDYEHRYLDLSDGTRLAYHVRRSDGPWLLLIPGSWGDFRVFDTLLRFLSPRLQIVIVELRGHGASWPPTLNGSIELFADDVLAVVDALGLERFYVGGHSIGGMIPIEIAGRRPESVAGAIAIEGWTHHEVQRQAFGGSPPPRLTSDESREIEQSRDRVRSHLTQEQIDAFASIWKRWNGFPILARTRVPILEIWGDRNGPRPSRALLRIPDRPNIELVWIEDASHYLLVESPKEVAEAIDAFIRDHDARSRKAIERGSS